MNGTKHRTKWFGLATWLLGWGVYRNAQNFRSIKRNIQTLYDQNVLQEIKFTVAALTDMRMTLAQLSLGLMSFQENVNAIYKYMSFIYQEGASIDHTT